MYLCVTVICNGLMNTYGGAATNSRWWTRIYVQVLVAIAVGALLGQFAPGFAVELKPLGDGFVKLVKMIVAPVVFLTVMLGIARSTSLRSLGGTAGRALIYFLSVSSFALVIGLLVANVVQPGAGLHIDPSTLDASAVSGYTNQAAKSGVSAFFLGIIPESFVMALSGNQMLPLLLAAVLMGSAAAGVGDAKEPLLTFMESAATVFFRLVAILMRLAPLGALGSIAFTVGNYGLHTLTRLGALVATFYVTSALFVFLVLGVIARFSGFSLWRLLVLLKDEIWLVLGTSSSESALPQLMRKLEEAGCAKRVVRLVVPAGYSFNLDGTNIYMTLAALFIAQATGIELSLQEELLLLLVAAVSSKGAAGVTGAGFVTLAATLSSVPSVPAAGIALVLGVDRFMSECRALTNFIGNAVATVVVSRWENALDVDRLRAALEAKKESFTAAPVAAPVGTEMPDVASVIKNS